jgi:hypothetical protein
VRVRVRVRVRVTGRVRVRLRVRRGAPHDQREVERREEAVRHHVRRARRPRSQPRGWLTHEEPLHEGSRLGVHMSSGQSGASRMMRACTRAGLASSKGVLPSSSS